MRAALLIAFWFFALALAASARAGDGACRNTEVCFAIGVTDVSVDRELQFTVGTWPFPSRAKLKTYVGDRLRFEWDARNEVYSKGRKTWIRKDPGLRTIWETSDGSKDPCAQEPWVASGQSGSHEEIIQPCAKGVTYRVRLISETIKPRTGEPVLEITVLPGPRPAARVPAGEDEEPASPPAAKTGETKPAEQPKAGEPAPAEAKPSLVDELDRLLKPAE